MSNKSHWENIYETKTPADVSWTQDYPQTSVDLITKSKINKGDSIIDIGGGDSTLVDSLLELGYTNLTVLDISSKSIARAKSRLGAKSNLVTWIDADITQFVPDKKYGLWHDRAAFHFLTHSNDIKRYASKVSASAEYLVLGTFSTNGPLKCSGLPITQYNKASLNNVFGKAFHLQDCFVQDHVTPFKTVQNFTFARFKKSS